MVTEIAFSSIQVFTEPVIDLSAETNRLMVKWVHV